MIHLEFREPHELFEKTEDGLKVKFDFTFYKVLYRTGDIIPKEKAHVKNYDGSIAYSIYDDPESVVYTIRIDDVDNSIMLNGFWQKKNE